MGWGRSERLSSRRSGPCPRALYTGEAVRGHGPLLQVRPRLAYDLGAIAGRRGGSETGCVRILRDLDASGSPFRPRNVWVGGLGVAFFWAPGRAHSLGGESPLHTRQGEVLARGKGVAGDCESEGSPRQSAGSTGAPSRTGSGYEATHRGKAAKKVKARYLHRTMRRISDRHKREGGCVIPGEICMAAIVLLTSRGVRMVVQKSAEAIVGAI
jgi:hypothetical protein